MNSNQNFLESINRLIETSSKPISNPRLSKSSLISNSSSNSNHINDISELDNLLEDLYNAKNNLSKSNLASLNDLNQTNSTSTSSTSSSPILSLSSPNAPLFRQLSISNNSRPSSTDNSSKRAFINKAEKELEELMSSLTKYKSNSNLNINQSVNRSSSFNEEIPIESENSSNRIKNKNLCYDCQEPINGQVITALGLLWHPDHFLCSYCHKSIGTSIFYEKDMKPYCEHDYLELFSPKCASCTKPILDKMLTALDKTWHVKCFICCSCNKMLNDESFLEINDSAYCKECYVNELAPKCKKCNCAIIENFISALNAYWHPSCFVCQECGVAFNSSSFYEYKDLPYCETHYHLKRGSLCTGCQAPINGRCVTAMNKKYHPEHFTCSFCLKQLNKGTFKENNDKPFCHFCFQKLFP